MSSYLSIRPDPLKGASKPASRWIRTAADEKAVKDGYLFNEYLVDHVVEWLGLHCPLTEGRWLGEQFVVTDWQREHLLGPSFGWIKPSGLRRHQYVFCQAPKKSPGKSTITAGLCLYQVCTEPGARVYNVAATKEQSSGIVFQTAKYMIELGNLAQHLRVLGGKNEIYFDALKGLFKSMPQRPFSGPSISFAAFDEIHEYKDRATYNSYVKGGIARDEPLFWMITNAGEDLETLCHQLYLRGLDYASGELLDPTWYTLVMEAPRKAAEEEIQNVVAGSDEIPVAESVNPHIGEIIKKEDLVAQIRSEGKQPWDVPNCLRYTYCVWVQADDREWLEPFWPDCASDYQIEDFEDDYCHAGFDRGSSRDFSSLVLLFERDELYWQIPFFWVPERRIKQLRHLIPIEQWAKQGLIHTFPGKVFLESQFRQECAEILDRFQVIDLTADKNRAEASTQWIEEDTTTEVVYFGQSHRNYHQFTVSYEELVISGKMRHPKNPVFTWQAVNAVRGSSGATGHIMPKKRHKDDYRGVDSIQSACMALASTLVPEDSEDYSHYEKNSVEFV